MSQRWLISLLVLVLLAWSFVARPVYHFLWVAAGRVRDRLVQRFGKTPMRFGRQAAVDRVLDQGEQITAYLQDLRHTAVAAERDCSSPEAFARSAPAARERLARSLRYPPPGFDRQPSSGEVPAQTRLGEDEFAVYDELRIPVLPGVQAMGVLLRPKSAPAGARLPLVISAHGRGGMPGPSADDTMDGVGKSRRDLAWAALERGYAVWMPNYVHYGPDGNDFRDRLTVRAWEAGTSLPAIEIAKTVRALDLLLTRPDIDAERVAMMGISYGGFYTLYTTALDPRIRVAALTAYFNDREAVLDSSEPAGFLDWRFADSLALWRDPQVAALVAPRPLLAVHGNQDQLFPIEGARKAAKEVAEFYQRLGIGGRFEFRETVARHDFDGATAMAFIDKHLAQPPAGD